MASLNDRIRRLEAAHGARQEDAAAARHRRAMDRLYHSLENGRRELRGEPPLPLPESLRESREEILETLGGTIPWYAARGSWGQDGTEANGFLRDWRDQCLEKLSEFDREEQTSD